MIGKIKDLYAKFGVEKSVPCGANAWWRRAEQFKYGQNAKEYNDMLFNGLDGVLEKEIFDFSKTTSVGKSLAPFIKTDVLSVKAVKNLFEEEGAIGAYNIEKKDISVDAETLGFAVYKSFLDNPNIAQESKKSLVNNLLKKNNYSHAEFMQVIKQNNNQLHNVIAHETTHAIDFAKIDVDKLNPLSFYLFVMSSEMHAHINQILDIVERGDEVWKSVSDFERKSELESYLKLNNLEVGEKIPSIYRQRVNEILINSWLYDNFGMKKPLLHTYQLEALKLLISRKNKHSGEKISLPKIFKLLEIDVSPHFLMKIEKEILTPSSNIVSSGFVLFKDKRKPIEKIADFINSFQVQRS